MRTTGLSVSGDTHVSIDHSKFASDIEEQLTCSVSFDIFDDPVIVPRGITYNKPDLLRWLDKNPCCPESRDPLNKNQLIPNLIVANIVKLLNEHRESEHLKLRLFMALQCPEIGGPFADPVIASNGVTYEKSAYLKKVNTLHAPIPNLVVKEIMGNFSGFKLTQEYFAGLKRTQEVNELRVLVFFGKIKNDFKKIKGKVRANFFGFGGGKRLSLANEKTNGVYPDYAFKIFMHIQSFETGEITYAQALLLIKNKLDDAHLGWHPFRKPLVNERYSEWRTELLAELSDILDEVQEKEVETKKTLGR